MAEYELMHCTIDDDAGVSQCKVSSFWNEEWWLTDYYDKRPNALRDAMTLRFPHTILRNRDVRRHQLVRHVPSGEVVGYARWLLPKEAANEWLEAQSPDASDEDKAKFEKIYDEVVWKFDDPITDQDDHVHGWRQELAPPGPHFELDYLCCRPDHRRKGVASMLVQAGLREADRLKMDACLVAMGLSAVSLYKKLGFEVKAEKQLNLEPYRQSIYYTFWVVRKAPQ
ncbi:hypothetical protein K4F52_001682 [Lecanicillium sp. MT-2017a]|nr:hypothetical protein K4F52_001682 [Lecanicillium sp. MT-2017a]